MKDDLMRRISDALDAPGGVDGDPDLRAALASDPEARAYADDLVRISEDLASLGRGAEHSELGDRHWDDLAARIAARLDADLDDIGDVTAPPAFSDELRADERPAPLVSQEVPVSGRAESAKVVDLSSRRAPRTAFYWMGGLAAAAAVGLGIMFGTSLDEGQESSVAVLAPEPPDYVQAEEAMGEAEPMPAPAEMPAAQAAVAAPAPVVAQAQQEPYGGLGAAADGHAGSGGARGGDLYDPFAERALRRAEPEARGAPAATPPARPVRIEALAAATGAVQHCIMQRRQTATVRVQVRADGSIDTVQVGAPYTGEEAACIERAVRAVRMPPSPTPYGEAHTFRPAPIAGTSSPYGGNALRARSAARESAPPPRPARQPMQPSSPSPSSEVMDAWAE